MSNTVVSFLPVFALTGQEHKLFTPLAYTKTFAITASALLAVTVGPGAVVLRAQAVPMEPRDGLVIGWRVRGPDDIRRGDGLSPLFLDSARRRSRAG